MRWQRRAALIGLVGSAGFVMLIAGLAVWSEIPLWRTEHRSWAVGYGLVGVGFAIASGLLARQENQQGNARLLAGLAVVWALTQANHRDLGILSAPDYVLAGFVQVYGATILLRYPGPELDSAGRRFVRVNLAIAAFFAVSMVLTGRPQWSNVDPHATWPGWANHSLNNGLWQAKAVWWAVAGLGFVWLLVRRWQRLGGLERHLLAPILTAAVAAATVNGLDWTRSFAPAGFGVALVSIRAFSGVGLSVAFVVSAVQLRLAHSRVADLIPRLAGVITVERVQDALRWSLSDPQLEVAYWVPARRAYVSGDGSIRDLAVAGTGRLVVQARSPDGAPLAAVLTDLSLGRHRALVESTVAVSGLALENARLQAGLRAQLRAVREARTRLLKAGLEERRRLERDLHDGAQQRLLAVGLRLGAIQTRATDPDVVQAIDLARSELHLALEELRRLAHGIYPAVLTQAGLAPAIEAVAERLPVPVSIDIPARRFRPDVESTAYFVVCEALSNAAKHAGNCTVAVLIDVQDDELEVEVIDNGIGDDTLNDPGALPHLRDRLAALGGRLAVASRPGTAAGHGTNVTARIPCA